MALHPQATTQSHGMTGEGAEQILRDAADYLQTKVDQSEQARNDIMTRSMALHPQATTQSHGMTGEGAEQILRDAADYLQTKVDQSEQARNDITTLCGAGHAGKLIRPLGTVHGVEMALYLRPAMSTTGR